MIPALAIDSRPEVGAAEAVDVGAHCVNAATTDDLVEPLCVGFGLDEQGHLAPAARHPAARLLVGPVVDVIAPLANPAWLGSVAAKIFDVPALAVLLAVAGRKALVAGIFLVDGFLHAFEERAIVGFVQCRLPEDYARVIAIAPYHQSCIVNRALLELGSADELP